MINSLKLSFFLLSLVGLFNTAQAGHSFTVLPQGTLPSQVQQGTEAIALYTVSNNTGSRVNHIVTNTLPLATVQSTDSGFCGPDTLLEPFGQEGNIPLANEGASLAI